jgi:chromate transport protein ChrA
MLLFLTINLGQMLIAQASFCPDPNGIQMMVVGILIALLIAVSGGMIVAIYLIASTMLAGLSWVGLITGGIFSFLQLPLDFHTLGFFGVIMLFVVGGIKEMLGCG